MGAHRAVGRPAQGGRGARLSAPAPDDRVWRVLPDLTAVDRAFDYLPAEAAPPVPVGTIVRVPLHGRVVRGWVLDPAAVPDAAAAGRLLRARAVTSAGPPPSLVELAEWGAWRWAGPRAALLRHASAPNQVPLESVEPEPDLAVYPPVVAPFPLPDVAVRVLVWPPASARAELVIAALGPEGSTIVVCPSPGEARELAAALTAAGRRVVHMERGGTAHERTRAWLQARRGACVVVGGRSSTWAPVPDLSALVLLDDADEALKEQRTPAWHARELGIERARRAGAQVTIVTPAPTVDAVAAANAANAANTTGGEAALARPAASMERAGWPRIDVVDRRADAPGLGLLGSGIGADIDRALADGGRALCILNRRGVARLLACGACQELARCAGCGAALADASGALRCQRCGVVAARRCATCGHDDLRPRRLGVAGLAGELADLVPEARVFIVDTDAGVIDDAMDVVVGTEAALHRVEGTRAVRLVVFLEFDAELLAPRYRSAEQAIWLVVRAARLVGARGHGAGGAGRVVIQTRVPDHEVLDALQRGDTSDLREADAERRRELRFPPFGGLAEISGGEASVALACAAVSDDGPGGVEVLGPDGARALLRAPSAPELADVLQRTNLSAARAAGRLRIDVDPLRV